ncbi:hypothetical protein PSTT_16939, partial [Puccinia striiformis]
ETTAQLEKENGNNKSRLEKENENNKSRLEKENQDNKIRWEKENSKLDTELKEVKAKHKQIYPETTAQLEKENGKKSRLEKEMRTINQGWKENQDNKIRWEKENSKLDTELKEVKAKHKQ